MTKKYLLSRYLFRVISPMILFLCIAIISLCPTWNTLAYSQTESPSSSQYALVASSSKKYIQEGKSLLVLDISRALSEPLKAVASQVPVFSQGFALSQDGALCLSGNGRDNEVTLIDVSRAVTSPAEAILSKIALQGPPSHIEISKARSIAFIAENSPGIIEVLDMEKAKTTPGSCLIASFPLERPVVNILVSPDNNYLLLIGEEIRVMEISRILSDPGNAGLYKVTPRFPPACALFDGKKGLFFISDISGIVLTIMKSVAIKGRLEISELSFGRAQLFSEDNLSFNAETHSSVPLHNLSLSPDAQYLFMPHPGLNRISIIDLTKTASGAGKWGASQVTAGQCPLQVCFTKDGEKALVNNFLSGNIYILDTRKCISAPLDALLAKIAVPAPCYMEVIQ